MLRMTFLTLAQVLVFALVAGAATKADLNVHREGKIGGVVLPAGVYRIEVPDSRDSVTLYRGRKEVVKVACRIEDLPGDVAGDSVVYRKLEDGGAEIVRIVLRDARIAIHIAGSAAQLPAALLGTAEL